MSGPSRCADGRGMPVGPGANGSAGSVDLFVLFVCLFFVVDVGSRAEDRLHEVDAQRGAGSGAREELAAGLLRDQAADVREDDHLDRRAGPATSDVAGNHGPGRWKPPQQEREDQDHAGRGPERKRWPIPMEASGLTVDLDPIDARRMRSGPWLRLSPPAGRLVLIDVPGATGPEKPPE